MTNTETLFHHAYEFQNKRSWIISEYETKVAGLERARGSQYYTDSVNAAQEARNAALSKLKQEYSERFSDTLKTMLSANSSRGVSAPTTEELNIIQALKMRDSITQAELDAAAVSLKKSPLCLSILSEMAQKNGFARGYLNYAEVREMPVNETEALLKGLAAELSDFIDHDTTKAARLYAAHQAAINGMDTPQLAKRSRFEDKTGFYNQIAGLSGDTLKAFCAAVDGE